MNGYTEEQAERLKHRIDGELAKIEDAAAKLRKIVPDTDPDRYANGGINYLLEQFREVGYGLAATVDRRTDDPKH
ncbi:MAG: hypothetical protein HUU17_06310 [Chthonomonadales bacterium]|nr:hypothetical protein [Chthonomonadales bacterium]